MPRSSRVSCGRLVRVRSDFPLVTSVLLPSIRRRADANESIAARRCDAPVGERRVLRMLNCVHNGGFCCSKAFRYDVRNDTND